MGKLVNLPREPYLGRWLIIKVSSNSQKTISYVRNKEVMQIVYKSSTERMEKFFFGGKEIAILLELQISTFPTL